MTKSGWVLALLALCGASLWAAPSGNTLFSVEYFYADNGMVTGRKINGDMQHYRYDKRGQLLSVTDAKGQILERYSYDPAGNILAKTIYGQTTTYIYDAANQLVSSTVDGRTTRYEYDAAGRLIKEGSKEYKYGYLDKVLAVQENGRITAAFDYHTDGQIAAAMTDKGDESFLWDDLALIRRNDTNLVNEPYATGGNPIVSGNDVLFNDMLGSTLGVKGQQNARVSMTAFGETNDPNAYFTGKPQVGELGYAFLFRNYRPEQGKWQTQDPLGYPDGWNSFAYCNNGVLLYFDRYGLAVGDIYGSLDAAADAWGKEFNGASITNNKEYGSSLYANGTGYSYTAPNIGGEAGVTIPKPPDGKNAAGDIHSHGAYDSKYGAGNDSFSSTDISAYDNMGTPGYMTTPNGSLQKYDPANSTTTQLSNSMPYDRNHPKPLKPE